MMATWDAAGYDRKAGFVPALGAALLDQLGPRHGERILDLGCGTGRLMAKIAEAGASVIGLDASPEMVARAREAYPGLPFMVADATSFTLEEPVDGVFSNAALHWMRPPEAVIARVATSLKPGGRFVGEMGGRGNIKAIVDALCGALEEEGVAAPAALSPWYFPSVGEYAALLEAAGFRVSLIQHFDRPTKLEGESGFADWVRIFAQTFLGAAPAGAEERVIARAEALARPKLYRQGQWWADYVRLRFVALKGTVAPIRD